MSCNCNKADPNCEPCAFCTPPGVKCLPDCNPPDPCPEEIDLCCVKHSGEDQPCSDIANGEPLCDLIIKLFQAEFPDDECCLLEMSIDLLANPATTTTTTSTTSTTTTSTTSSTTSTTSTTTTTTVPTFAFCSTSVSCTLACSCEVPNTTLYSNCATLIVGCVLYTNTGLTVTAPAGYYGRNGKCYIVSAAGVITAISNCLNSINLCYSVNQSDIPNICICLTPDV